jgi:hypothetical protein
VFFADLEAFEAQQVFGALNGVAKSAVRVVEQGCIGQAGLLLVLRRSGEAVGVEFAAESVKFLLKQGGVEA